MSPRACAALLALAACRREPAALPADTEAPPSPRVESPARYRPALREVLRPEARRALDESTVTLLVPDDPGLVATAVVTSGPHWAAISIARGDHTLAVHASRAPAPVVAPAPQPARRPEAPTREERIRGFPAVLSGGDGQRAATWEERGVTYVLNVACTAADDPRCARERFVRDLATSLVPLEGAR